jgi:hypothetical protein
MYDSRTNGWMSEDEVKARVGAWLKTSDWQAEIAWGKRRGTDILAVNGDARWLIEAKGGGSLNAMRVNYFLMILGEILQRMEDPTARYSIALPDMVQFRRLWTRLPQLAKDRLALTALFVASDGSVEVTD